MKRSIIAIAFVGAFSVELSSLSAQDRSIAEVNVQIKADLDAALLELSALQDSIEDEKVPLSRELSEFELELTKVRDEFDEANRVLDNRVFELTKLQERNGKQKEEVAYLLTLLSNYMREFETRIHRSETSLYEAELDKVRLALENEALPQGEVLAMLAGVMELSLKRLESAVGGHRFDGRAVNADGEVKEGRFVLVGPAAIFRSTDGLDIGVASEQLNSFESTASPFGNPEDKEAAAQVVATTAGYLPFDPTLGNALMIESTDESFIDHVQKGGPVMIPIFVMAGAGLLVAIYKWLSMAFIKRPTQAQLRGLLNAVGRRDEADALEEASAIQGPVGDMLSAGVEHLHEPRELIEEFMYESMLTTKLKLQGLLPFIAICAASAPLLGLLGTVTGIISTFKLITVFGSGDVKSLSGGISEALITTKFGLIVAIPSLLVHAFLSRKARGLISHMETAAVSFINQVSKTPTRTFENGAALAEGPVAREERLEAKATAGSSDPRGVAASVPPAPQRRE